MVLVTDGGDTASNKDFHQALEAAQLADTVMYPVVVVPITNDAGRNIGGENALTTLAAGTGGRVFTPSVGAELDTRLRRYPARAEDAIYDRLLPEGCAAHQGSLSHPEGQCGGPEFASRHAQRLLWGLR